ncbi:hypothetical protein PsorP6_011333 [Peronosclerospora sorghi]|uniref:Uncharacterized protein n=1 Tax=Peronosclerospora sorghi TaxID=230839 RepID=A0ACC0WIW3_9STRA|nr:hypothetical protein PsorP6_011333 [Peronosclerospora sorghi]
MADRTKGSDSGLGRSENSEAWEPSSSLRRTVAIRSNRSKRQFGSRTLRVSLKIDPDCSPTGEIIGESTPALPSSSCRSDVLPWWEVEYQCPPPGHLGAHVVPVSAPEETVFSSPAETSAFTSIGTPRSAETKTTRHVSVQLSTPILTPTRSKDKSIQPGAGLHATRDHPARQGRQRKLSTRLASAPRCTQDGIPPVTVTSVPPSVVLVDNSSSPKRPKRRHDPTDGRSDLVFNPLMTERRNAMAETAADWKAKGNAALSSGNAQEAVDCYTKAIALDASDHVFYSNRSAAYLSLDDATHALEDADRCIQTKPDWAKGYSRKGAALHALKRYDEAKDAYNEGLKLDAANAACLSGMEEVKKAQAAASQPFNPLANAFGPNMFGKIATNPRISPFLSDPSFVQKLQEIQRDPSKINEHIKDSRVMTVLGELMGLNLNMNEAPDEEMPMPTSSSSKPEPTPTPEPTPMEEDLTEEEKAEREAKKRAEEAKERGNAFYKQKNFSEAIKCYNEAIEIDGANLSYYSNLAAVKLEMGQYDACIEDCKKAIEVGRANRADYALIAKAYVRIGNAYLKKGETEENLTAAIDAYESAQMENRTKDVERKIKALQVKLRKVKELAYVDPEKALEAKNEGNEFFKNGDFPKAVERYTEAIKRDPSCAVYYANRAAAYTKLTSFNEAKKDCEKAIELDPKYVKAYSRMGAIQCFMKEFHKARESYEKGLALDPSNQECNEGLRNVMYKIQSGETDEERARHGMADPEIQAILRDPVMQNVLNDFQTDPAGAQRHLQNPGIMAKIEKLIAAGVLQTK